MSNTALSPYLRDIRNYPILSHEDEVSLIKAIRNGSDQATEQLVTSHLRFVVSIAKQYQRLGLPLDDLIHEGNIGLINAIERFDETRGVKFSTYASWLIRRHIFQALVDTSKMVKLPNKQILALLKQYRTLRHLSAQLQRHQTDTDTLRHLEQQLETVEHKLGTTFPYVSLDAPIAAHDDAATFLDFLPEDEAKQPDQIVSQKIAWDFATQALTELSERERTIIELYYGLHDQEPKTLKEIGELLGISRERVRQIKADVLEKLRGALCVRN